MIPPTVVMRVARPTDNLEQIARMYQEGLGFQVLAQFQDHQGFDGIILGHPQHPYHFEFTHHRGARVGKAPTKDNLIVFYIPDHQEWATACAGLTAANFQETVAYNPYWDVAGKTFEDLDGYRIVLQNRAWMA